jgi:hypothetical protein
LHRCLVEGVYRSGMSPTTRLVDATFDFLYANLVPPREENLRAFRGEFRGHGCTYRATCSEDQRPLSK